MSTNPFSFPTYHQSDYQQASGHSFYGRTEGNAIRQPIPELMEAAYVESNSSLLEFYKSFIKMLLKSLGRDVDEIETIINVKRMEDPKQLVRNLHENGVFSLEEQEQLARIHEMDAAGWSHSQEPKLTVSSLLNRIENKISPDLANGLRSAEIINSPHFLQFLQDLVERSSTPVDEKQLYDTMKQQREDGLSRSALILAHIYSYKSQAKNLSDKISQLNSEISGLTQEKNRSIKITENLQYTIKKISPDIPFNNLNLDQILDNVSRRLKGMEADKENLAKRCEDLDTEILQLKIEHNKLFKEKKLAEEDSQFRDQVLARFHSRLRTALNLGPSSGALDRDLEEQMGAVLALAKTPAGPAEREVSARPESTLDLQELQNLRQRVAQGEEEISRLKKAAENPTVPPEFIREKEARSKDLADLRARHSQLEEGFRSLKGERDDYAGQLKALQDSEAALKERLKKSNDLTEQIQNESNNRLAEASGIIKDLQDKLKKTGDQATKPVVAAPEESLQIDAVAPKNISQAKVENNSVPAESTPSTDEKDQLIQQLRASIAGLEAQVKQSRDLQGRVLGQEAEIIRQESELANLRQNEAKVAQQASQIEQEKVRLATLRDTLAKNQQDQEKNKSHLEEAEATISQKQLQAALKENQLLEAERELKKREKDAAELAQKYGNVQDFESRLNSQLLTAQQDKKKLEESLQNATNELGRKESELREQKARFEGQIGHLEQDRKNLQASITGLQNEFTQSNGNVREQEFKLNNQIIQLQTQIQALQTEIAQTKRASEEREAAQNQELASLAQTKKDLTEKLSAATSDLEKASQLSKLQAQATNEEKQKAADWQKKAEALDREIQELKTKSAKKDEDISKSQDVAVQFESASKENVKLRELVSVMEGQISKLDLSQKEESARSLATINQLKERLADFAEVKRQAEELEEENNHFREQMKVAEQIQTHNHELEEHIKRIVSGEIQVEGSPDHNEELNRLLEENQELIEKLRVAQDILDENEQLKMKLESMQQDNEMMAQALEEINEKIESGEIKLITANNEGEEEEAGDQQSDGQEEREDQVRIRARPNNIQRQSDNGQGQGLSDLNSEDLIEELRNIKAAYEELHAVHEEKEAENEQLKQENEELRDQLTKILEEVEGQQEEEQEGHPNDPAEGEEEAGERDHGEGQAEGQEEGQDEEANADQIIAENDNMIEILKELSEEIDELRGAYSDMIEELAKNNEKRNSQGLDFKEFVRSAEDMQQKVRDSQNERGMDNMIDFNNGLKESVEFYDNEKQKLIQRLQAMHKWCKEDDPDSEQEENEPQAGEEEQPAEEPEQDRNAGNEEQEEQDPLSTDKLVELLLITLQLIETIRETASNDTVSQDERLYSIVESINNFEQMGDSGEGNFELAAVLEKIVQNRTRGDAGQEDGEAGAEEAHENYEGQEENHQEEQDARGQEEQVRDSYRRTARKSS